MILSLATGAASAAAGPQLQFVLTATSAATAMPPPEQSYPGCCPNTLTPSMPVTQASMVLPEQFIVLSLTLTCRKMQPGITQRTLEERNKDLCLALLRSLHQPVSTQRAAERGSDTSLLHITNIAVVTSHPIFMKKRLHWISNGLLTGGQPLLAAQRWSSIAHKGSHLSHY